MRRRTAGGIVQFELVTDDGTIVARTTRHLGSFHGFFRANPGEKMTVTFSPPTGDYRYLVVKHISGSRHRNRPARVRLQHRHAFGSAHVDPGDTIQVTVEIGTP